MGILGRQVCSVIIALKNLVSAVETHVRRIDILLSVGEDNDLADALLIAKRVLKTHEDMQLFEAGMAIKRGM